MEWNDAIEKAASVANRLAALANQRAEKALDKYKYASLEEGKDELESSVEVAQAELKMAMQIAEEIRTLRR